MSILQSHHVIEQSVFSKNDLLQVLVAGGFDRDGSKNRIYLPVDNDLAEEVGSSPHRGRTLSSYNLMSMSLVESIMDTAAGKLVMSGDSDPDALHQVAHKVNELQDTLKVALINGDVFASRPAHMSKDQANMHNRQFFANIDQYRIEHSEQLEALRGMRPIESVNSSLVRNSVD